MSETSNSAVEIGLAIRTFAKRSMPPRRTVEYQPFRFRRRVPFALERFRDETFHHEETA
ncbi:hypothetical protein RSSM_00705 [Rhodopirellula sallentina SM41]|uniref:Uncharacterized protein n=1 Tax=Rhodopirellula sallentina SM41 TaxID=1263870 RepID=M5U8N7_9BACT|nr:hypothetical protein RSSM_00705 [Rhodopirellula sallentina SM41]